MGLFFTQVFALQKKDLLLLRRRKFSTCCTCICPILLFALGNMSQVVKSLLSAATALDSESREKRPAKQGSKYKHWQQKKGNARDTFAKKRSHGWREDWSSWQTPTSSAPVWQKIGDQWFSVCPVTGWHEPWRSEKVDRLETLPEPSAPSRLPPDNDAAMEDLVRERDVSEVRVTPAEGSYASTGPSVPAADAPEVIYA
eukprot:GEMP01063734.1.p1 GENE.GEMP01063734.1~~GEMP01063734.1.p1  ORF type:complete len:199 (+),score=45.74 GEMP01063734.1:185-781(+)